MCILFVFLLAINVHSTTVPYSIQYSIKCITFYVSFSMTFLKRLTFVLGHNIGIPTFPICILIFVEILSWGLSSFSFSCIIISNNILIGNMCVFMHIRKEYMETLCIRMTFGHLMCSKGVFFYFGIGIEHFVDD